MDQDETGERTKLRSALTRINLYDKYKENTAQCHNKSKMVNTIDRTFDNLRSSVAPIKPTIRDMAGRNSVSKNLLLATQPKSTFSKSNFSMGQ